MIEREFWTSLEFQICREFAKLPDRRHRHLWCDGLDPRAFLLDDAAPRITGIAWICGGPAMGEWQFALLLPSPCASRQGIDWSVLLPPEGTTRWMSFDEGRRYLEIEPAVAVPDLR